MRYEVKHNELYEVYDNLSCDFIMKDAHAVMCYWLCDLLNEKEDEINELRQQHAALVNKLERIAWF